MKSYNEKDSVFRSFLKNNKVVVSLLSLCLIGGLAIYSFQSAVNRNSLENNDGKSSVSPENPADINVSSDIPVKDSRDSASDSSADGAAGGSAEGTGQGAISIMPAEGKISKDYSGDSLVYSETLNQYICHKAVDISAAAGSAVSAVESGTIISAEKDDRYGLTVTISHGEGLETSYSCLGEASVSVGDVVTKGDKIGTVGEDALFESTDGPHLHFEASKDGTPANPHELWNW